MYTWPKCFSKRSAYHFQGQFILLLWGNCLY